MGRPSMSPLSHATNIHALPDPTDEEFAKTDDEKVAVKGVHPDIDELALIRKVDLWVIPVLCLLVLFASLDRVNIANAAVYGMSEELGLVAEQYNAALTIL